MKKLSAKHFKYAIADLAAALQQQIEADCSGFPSDPKASAARREQALADFTFFRRTYFPHYCTILGDSALHTWLDATLPSMAKACEGQHIALVGGLLRDTMTLDVVEASIRKRHPDRIIEDVIALHEQYRCLNWAVEAVQFQAFFADVLAQRAAARGLALPVRPIINSTDKQLRIETLQPYMTQGRIRLHTSQQTLIDQLRHFPKADHDDGPDALEMLWRLAVGGFISLRDAFERVPRQSLFGTRFDDDDFDDDATFGGWT